MNKELIEKLALLYVQANAVKGTSATEIYQMYKSATEEIQKTDSDSFQKHVEDGSWGL